MDDIFEHLGKSGLCIYLDPKKAFDTVDHSILLHKMYNYGMYSKVKVKFSHTRYRVLGPELIPVYRQSARR